MSTNDEIEDAITRHQIFVQRYAKGREEAYQLYIEDLLEQTRARLTFDLTPESRVRTERLMLDLKALAEQLTGELTEETMDEMRRFMTQEAQFNYEILDTRVVADLSLPNANQIEAALSTNIMKLEPTKGYTIRSALAEFGSRKAQQIVQVIRDGTVLGETTQAIIQGIMDLGSVQKRQASTLARTITNHVATQARDLTMGDNRDILEGYKWVATLDGRTSLICASRDGKIFPIADDSPKPPAHFNCRSTISFAVKPEFDLGADLPGTRSSIDGPVDRNLTFGDWLRRQSPEFQDQVLGKERAKLFREQNIPIDRFVDDQGRVLSLDQLRRMDEDYNGLAPIPVPEPPAPIFQMKPAEEIVFKTPREARKAIAERFAAAEADLRYDPDKFRFRGRRKDFGGRASALKNMPAEIVQAFDAAHDELDELAKLFDIPPLRGLARIRGNSKSAADMGDGIMGVNANYNAKEVPSFQEAIARNKKVKEWQSGFDNDTWAEDRISRPFSTDSFFDNGFDRFRTTLYHEFGHHVHQMYGVKPGEFMNKPFGWQPRVEEIISQAKYRTIYRKAPTWYGDTNEREWFAENFSLYFMDRKDKVDPLFIELIEELLDGSN